MSGPAEPEQSPTEQVVEQLQDPPAQETPQTEEGAKPPELNDSIREMGEKLEALEAAVKPPAPEVDPVDRIMGRAPQSESEWEYEDGTPAPPPQQPQAQPQAEGETDDDAQLMAEFEQMVDQRAQQAILPYLQQQEAQRREREILGMADEFPNFNERAPEIAKRLDALAARYQNPHLRTDPELVRREYLALEAEAIRAEQAPAEAGGRGASIEQGAGPGTPETADDPVIQEYERAIVRGSGGGDAFTS